MKLIAGLGNPGPRYAESRHNVGYAVADELARRWGAGGGRYDRDFQGQVAEVVVGGERVHLLKPATFMNLSGQSVAAVTRFYKLAPADVLVIYDDLDLPLGTLRVRAAGSAGGHRGMNHVLLALGTDAVPRVRLGIGKVHRDVTVDHVLSRFLPEERETIAAAVVRAADAAECWVRRGPDAAMNEFNRRPEGESSGDRARKESHLEALRRAVSVRYRGRPRVGRGRGRGSPAAGAHRRRVAGVREVRRAQAGLRAQAPQARHLRADLLRRARRADRGPGAGRAAQRDRPAGHVPAG